LIPGRVLFSNEDSTFLSRGPNILVSSNGGNSWDSWVHLPGSLTDRILTRLPLISRLLRKGVHHLENATTGTLVISGDETFILKDNEITRIGSLQGSRPLVLCQAADVFYYGEYRSNPGSSAVHIWQWQEGDSSWSPVWRFDGVRHVHGVFHDPYSKAIWVTTGDRDSEVGIWRTDDGFSTLTKVVGGSQQFRAVQLLFTTENIYFGSDTPDEENFIYRMDRATLNVECLAAVGGSVFYGCKVGEKLFFSTAVEPSRINSENHAEVWRSDNGLDWYKFLKFKKDIWSMKYFQYGQVFFPAGPGDDKHLYCTPFATRGHGKTFVIEIENTTTAAVRNETIETR